MRHPLFWSRPTAPAGVGGLNSLPSEQLKEMAGSHLPDRHFTVPPGQIVRTAYVDIFQVRPGCRERMAVGDVDRAFQKVLRSGPGQAWPCPYGHWEHSTFVIEDGRHEWLACIMNGYTHILVAWMEARI